MLFLEHDQVTLTTGELGEIIRIVPPPNCEFPIPHYAIKVKGTGKTKVVSQADITERTLRFLTWVIPMNAVDFAQLRTAILLNRCGVALVYHGDMIGFVMQQYPDAVPVSNQSTAKFSYPNFSLTTLQQWQAFDVVTLEYNHKAIGYFVPAHHIAWVPLPMAPKHILQTVQGDWLEKLWNAEG